MPMRSHSVTCHPTQVNYIYLDIDQLGPEYEGAVFHGSNNSKNSYKNHKNDNVHKIHPNTEMVRL